MSDKIQRFIVKSGYCEWYTMQHCSHPSSVIKDGALVEDIETRENIVHKAGEWAVCLSGTGIMTTIPEQFLRRIPSTANEYHK